MGCFRRKLACIAVGFVLVGVDGQSHSDKTPNIDGVADPSGGVTKSLEELWASEKELAQNELQRFLQNFYRGDGYSMPAHRLPGDSTPAPIVLATQAPSIKPDPPTESPQAAPVTTFSPNTPLPTHLNANCLKGRTPEQYLLDKLLEISTVNLLLDPLQPQGMAFNFILGDATVRNNVCTYPTVHQRYGLATLFYSTKGEEWLQKLNWITNAGECEWHGVTCRDGSRVTGLDLSSNNLEGTLPDELSALFDVGGIQFFSNSISGEIPAGIGNLTNIELLDLEQNQLRGSGFPSAVVALPKLKQLFLSNNEFTGTIPVDIGARLPGLTDFWAASNALVGPLSSSIGEMTNLRTLILYDNSLDSSLPSTFNALTDLTNLQLYKNIFDQKLPISLFELTSLTSLRLDHNFLTGRIPSALGKLSALTDLRFHNNFFESKIPEDLFNLNQLRVFTAGTNLFTGSIPNIFVGFRHLEDLDLSTCFFSGSIPDTIFDNPGIQRVYLNNNALGGGLPASYANSPALVDLYLDSNLLTGTVTEATSLPQLQELLLQNNLFTGTIPPGVCSLRSTGSLQNFFSDCGGANPEVDCTFPNCCNRCFEGGSVTDQRRELETRMNSRLEEHRQKPNER